MTLATLAMPGSPNFVGEILILFGTFEDKFVFGVVASLGVALAAVYMIRVFQKSMHNRVAEGVEAAEMDGLGFVAIVPVTAVVVALGVYPQLVLDRTDGRVREAAAGGRRARAGRGPARGGHARGRRRAARRRAADQPRGAPAGAGGGAVIDLAAAQAPEIDYQGLSPLFATIGGTVAVLMAGPDPRPLRPARAGAAASPRPRCSRRSA